MIEWEDKYSVGISIIDEKHKELFGIINKIIVAKQYNKNPKEILEKLNEMIQFAQKHFKTEETYMIMFKYPEYEYHKDEHDDFSFKMIAYNDRVIDGDYKIANDILEYLKRWFVNHIQKTDKKYADYFIKNGLK